MRHLLRPLPVVRDQQQAGRLDVQTAHREEPGRHRAGAALAPFVHERGEEIDGQAGAGLRGRKTRKIVDIGAQSAKSCECARPGPRCTSGASLVLVLEHIYPLGLFTAK